MPRLPDPDEPHFFARDPASEVLRTHRAAEDEAALRSLDSALLRRCAEFDAQRFDEDDLEFGPLSSLADPSSSFDERTQDLLDPFAGSRVEARARSLVDTHRKAFEARNTLAGHRRSDRPMVRALERVLEDNKQAVAMQPDLIDVALARADTALDWSEDEREAQRTAFDKDLAQRLLRADITKGNIQAVLQELDDEDLALDPETTAILRREVQTARGHARAAFRADADAALSDVDETAGTALIAQAHDILAEGQQDAFTERVRQAQTDTAFRIAIRFMTPKAVATTVDRDVDPLELLTGTDRERRQAIAREVLEARTQDPVDVLMADPTVASWFADGTSLETALTRRLRAQLDIGVAAQKVLPRDQARPLAAELNSLPSAARMARLVELAGRHGKHHATTIRQLVEQSLDRPAQALAAAHGHPALALALIDAQIVGRAKLREGLDSREIDAVEAAITQALDGADTNGFRFVFEDLAFRAYKQAGNAELAARDAVALARDAFKIETSGKPDAEDPESVTLT